MSVVATAVLRPLALAAPPPLRTHRFTVAQYEQLTELGILTPDDRVELLEGWIVDKLTQHPPHAAAIDYVYDALRAVLPEHWRVRDQKPIHAADSLPEPDLAIVVGPRERYTQHHPVPADIGLVIEVADTTLEDDRDRKGRIYASARILQYWILNLPEGRVEVYTQPRAGKSPTYKRRQDYSRTEAVPLVLGGQEIARIPVSDLLPK